MEGGETTCAIKKGTSNEWIEGFMVHLTKKEKEKSGCLKFGWPGRINSTWGKALLVDILKRNFYIIEF